KLLRRAAHSAGVTIDRYGEIFASFRWDVPADFNIARACCQRWAEDRARFALYWEDEDGAREAWTFFDLREQANRLSNALRARGVGHCARHAAGEIIAPVRRRGDCGARPGIACLHERHDRTAQGRVDAAMLSHRQPARLRPFAQRLSARGRPVLVSGGLGVDR